MQYHSHVTTGTPAWQNQFGNFTQLDHRGWPINQNHLNDGHYAGDPNQIRPSDLTTIYSSHSRCLHDECPRCRSGVASCIHALSCPCPKCSPICCRAIQ